MSIQQPRFDTQTQVDFVVIGAGAAGGVIAKELSTAGFQVVVLEQGPYLKKDFNHDEIKTFWQSATYQRLEEATHHFELEGKGQVQPAVLYGRMVAWALRT